MKTWQLSILAAAAALGLQACDVSVRDAAPQDSAATSQPAPESSAPQVTSQPAPAAAASDSTTLPSDAPTTVSSTPSPAPSSPDTAAMGAAAGAGTAPLGAPAMPAVADGAAAPSELARFLEENPVKPRMPEASAGKTEEGKSSAAKAENKGGTTQAGKS